MSDVYWLGGADLSGWKEELARLGIRPAWIEEVHWIGIPPQPDWVGQAPAFQWPTLPDLEARLLQNAARLLAGGERSLVLLAAPEGVALLASPRAVGRLNLAPAAQISAWQALPEGSEWEAVAKACACDLPVQQERLANGSWQVLFPARLPEPVAVVESTPVLLPVELLERCEALRQEVHEPAELLWQLLDGRQINQMEFSRQQELDGQILDFFCPEAGLVVLIDYRSDMEDAYRMHVFTQHGLRVLRFWNSQVIEDTAEVLQVIWQAVSGATPAEIALQKGQEAERAVEPAEVRPSANGIGGLNVLCRHLKSGERGLVVESSPGQPVMVLQVEGL